MQHVKPRTFGTHLDASHFFGVPLNDVAAEANNAIFDLELHLAKGLFAAWHACQVIAFDSASQPIRPFLCCVRLQVNWLELRVVRRTGDSRNDCDDRERK
jgi:hypothetical protein